MKNSGYTFLILWLSLILMNILGWTTLSWALLLSPIWVPFGIILITVMLFSIILCIIGFILIIKTFKYNDRNQ